VAGLPDRGPNGLGRQHLTLDRDPAVVGHCLPKQLGGGTHPALGGGLRSPNARQLGCGPHSAPGRDRFFVRIEDEAVGS
jgi:hypothetical protein